MKSQAENAYESLNELFVDLFHEVLEIEECAIRQTTQNALTMTEIHTLVAIGEGKKSMSEVAAMLGVTVSTLTIAVNKLVAKDYVVRERDHNDRRVVHISLNHRGQVMVTAHERFHRRMTRSALEGLSEEEVEVLPRGVIHLKEFFYKELERYAHPQADE